MITGKCSHCSEPFGWFQMVKSIFSKFKMQCSSCKKYSQVTQGAKTSINLFCLIIPCLAGVVTLNIFVFLAIYGGMLLSSPIFMKFEKARKG